ncbi:hypothetical protein [Streptomyces longispororuber]|uniref:hypothetical protein n=1 Tax=Streptomyces longispororuber TaxID=68230 RepID=UPI00210E663C|nr:hypothetical protein [Streptomyces longispororuber]MCQ4211793.1 hypothetical protein [Streptomyces longispororuber]
MKRGRARGDRGVLGQRHTRDGATRGVVPARRGPGPPPHFFTPPEEATARPLLDQLLAQGNELRVPLLQSIDARLTDGRRFAGLPEDAAAWRASLADRAAIHLAEGARAGRRAPETPVRR